MYQLQVEQLLKAGAHFGHPTSKWNPNFKPYIATKKNGIHIIDLEETVRAIERADKEILNIVLQNLAEILRVSRLSSLPISP